MTTQPRDHGQPAELDECDPWIEGPDCAESDFPYDEYDVAAAELRKDCWKAVERLKSALSACQEWDATMGPETGTDMRQIQRELADHWREGECFWDGGRIVTTPTQAA